MVGIVLVGLLLAVGLFLAPIIYDGFRSASQRRALLNRSDYPQIATACVTLARATTNDSVLLYPNDSLVPALLKSLSPRYVSVSSNHVTLEFHGGFDHYGYSVHQSDTNSKQWMIFFYTEKSRRLLATISHDAQ
jgi:hypothetical protein